LEQVFIQLAGLTALGGQFTISNRDTNNPRIKTVRVVSTVEYYLSD